MSNVYSSEALKNRIVVVTGGGRGIGSGISKVVAAAGGEVVIIYPTDAEQVHADNVIAEITSAGGKASAYRCDIGVRYWEDGKINGVEDSDDNPQMPLLEYGRWKLDIDLSSGKIKNWPEGTTASVHYKVCDDGRYQLLDEEGNVILYHISATEGINEFDPSYAAANIKNYTQQEYRTWDRPRVFFFTRLGQIGNLEAIGY